MNQKTKRILSLAIAMVALLGAGAIAWYVGMPMIRYLEHPEQFRLWVNDHGAWGRLAYVGMVIFQVVLAVIPGEPVEFVGGYAFGFWEGTLWCTVGNILGGMLIFALVRLLGARFVALFVSLEKINSMGFLKNSRRRDTLIFLIYLFPGTPKDWVAYFVGLTPMKWYTWLLISGVARLPSVVTSTVAGSALSLQRYGTALWVAVATALVSVAGWLVYNWLMKKHQQRKTLSE